MKIFHRNLDSGTPPDAGKNLLNPQGPPEPTIFQEYPGDYAINLAARALWQNGEDPSNMNPDKIAHRFGYADSSEYLAACKTVTQPNGAQRRFPPEKVLALLHYTMQKGDLTEKELGILRRQFIVVIGSSVGAGLALATTAKGFAIGSDGRICIFDPSKLDPRHYRQPLLSAQDYGGNKAIITAREIQARFPYANITAFPHPFTPDYEEYLFQEDSLRPTMIVEETDDLLTKLWVGQVARKYGVPVVMATDLMGTGIFDLYDYSKPKIGLFGKDHTYDWESMIHTEGDATVLAFILGLRNMTPEVLGILKGIEKGKIRAFPQEAGTVTTLAGIAAHLITDYALGIPVKSRSILRIKDITRQHRSLREQIDRNAMRLLFLVAEGKLQFDMRKYRIE